MKPFLADYRLDGIYWQIQWFKQGRIPGWRMEREICHAWLCWRGPR
jgi:hypothetical protein